MILHDFPLPHVHCGTTLGNGVTGLSVWGAEDSLHITIGNSALWDHRGGAAWRPEQSYARLRELLESGDREALFTEFQPGGLTPSILPVGRLTLRLGAGAALTRCVLHLEDGLVEAVYRRGHRTRTIRIRLSQSDKGLFQVKLPEAMDAELIPAFRLSPVLAERGFEPPREDASGFTQARPADPPFRVDFRRENHTLVLRFGETRHASSWEELTTENREYWRGFHQSAPTVELPDAEMQKLFDYHLFRFQCITAADGVPAGLQGPWIEDDRLPPWSSDYHFNINVQMCYAPAFQTGQWKNLLPLFNMLESWRDTMRHNAKCFVGIDDGFTMPHAVDDRCVAMGDFWAGMVDHGCSLWMAHLVWEHARYSGDLEFLRRFGFEYMNGVMRVAETMLEERGGELSLPCAVSPEYRGNAVNAWGKNPSFQLAAIHRLALDLDAAAGLLGKTPSPAWRRIREQLPLAALCENELAIWEETMLEESHRHHSHLAGICPFDLLSPEDSAWQDILRRSETRWIAQGMGRWAGWSMPWAAMLHNRFGNAEMAVFVLDLWRKAYVNSGGGTLHDTAFPGLSVGLVGDNTIMQMDAGMGALAAILDLFVYESRGELFALHGIPDSWRAFTCRDIRCPDGFLFSAERREGITRIEIAATRPAMLKLRFGNKRTERKMTAGEKFIASWNTL